MAQQLQGKRVAFLATEGVEQAELEQPLRAVREAGADVDLLDIDNGELQAFNHLDKGDRFPVDRTVQEASADEYDALVLPGGVANPDRLLCAKVVEVMVTSAGGDRSRSPEGESPNERRAAA